MSYTLLSSFNALNTIEKCVLKLAISNIIDLSEEEYAKEFKNFIPLARYRSLVDMSAPVSLEENVAEQIKTLFRDASKNAGSYGNPKLGLNNQVKCLCSYLNTKFYQWDDGEEDDDEDDEEERQQARKRRMATVDLSEAEIVSVLADVLNIIFCRNWTSLENR